ncbi:hypothetical protein V5799_026434 [Amblyomma americanum]|uniref:RRM domain-containing protein n=1 Tax=Amblyomma americanum TaxID=6943 RepID=A0AAQ4DIL5_AMBAM
MANWKDTMTSRVYVGRLNYEVRERDLERFFKGFGRIREISIKNGFGFVEFDDHRDADDAVYELNGKELLGDRVSVELARGIRRGADYYRSRAASRSPPRRRFVHFLCWCPCLQPLPIFV